MFSRFFITVNTFLVVFGLYLVYGWVLVPRVLPEIKEIARPVEIPEVRDEQNKFAFLFAANDWERTTDDIKILEMSDTIVLLQNREIINGTKIKASPCTILLLPNDTTLSRKERLRQSVMIRTLDYAMLEMDGSVEKVSSGPLRFKRGDLAGRVTITSDMKETGPRDDLSVVTRDVVLTVQPALTTISSFHDVAFRLAQNHGEGKDITIEMVQSNPRNAASPKILNKVQLLNLKEFVLSGEGGISNAVGPVAGAGASGSTVRITCKQDFLLRPDPNPIPKGAKNWIAQFRDEVHVQCTNPDKTRDTIDCGQLLIYLQPKPAPKVAGKPGNTTGKPAPTSASSPDDLHALGNLEISRILALWSPAKPAEAGKPAQTPKMAVLRSPSRDDFRAEGERILYDLALGCVIVMKERPELPPVRISAKKGEFSLNAASVAYQMGKTGGFDFLTATGGGDLRGIMGGEGAPKKFVCSWNALDLRPDPKNKSQLLITLNGKVKADIETVGTMSADTALFWCIQRPRPENPDVAGSAAPSPVAASGKTPVESPFGNVDLIPDRAQVFGNVTFTTESGTCRVKQMDAFFCEERADGSVRRSVHDPVSDREPRPTFSRRVMPESRNHVATADYVLSDSMRPLEPLRDYAAPLVRQVQHSQPVATASHAALPRPTGQGIPMSPVSPTGSPTPTVSRNNQPAVNRDFLFGSAKNGPRTSTFSVVGEQLYLRIRLASESHSPEGGAASTAPPASTVSPFQQQAGAAGKETPGKDTNIPASSVEQFRIVGDVTIREKVLIGSQNHAMTISGKEIHVWEPDTDAMEIKIIGDAVRRAVFQGKGVELVSSNINISRPNNRLWIVGEGQLTTELALANTPLAVGSETGVSGATIPPSTPTTTPKETAFVRWNKGMQFDGNILSFEGEQDIQGQGVKVYGKTQHIYAQTVSVYLNRFFSFFDDSPAEGVAAETIDCAGSGGIGGNLLIQNEQYDETGRLQSRDEAECVRLLVHVPSTQFQLQGPGRLSSRFMEGDPGNDSGAPVAVSARPGASNGPTLVDIAFHDYTVGNRNQRVLKIAGQIRCVHYPLAGWEEAVDIDNLNEIAKRGAHLNCDVLDVVQMYEPHSSVELTATGNTRIEGSGYFARAETIRYNQAKDLLSLDGNGFADAQLYKGTDTRVPLEAQGIDYNLRTGDSSIRGFRGTRIGGL